MHCFPKVHRNCSCKTFWSNFMVLLFVRTCCWYVPPHFKIWQWVKNLTQVKSTPLQILSQTKTPIYITITFKPILKYEEEKILAVFLCRHAKSPKMSMNWFFWRRAIFAKKKVRKQKLQLIMTTVRFYCKISKELRISTN